MEVTTMHPLFVMYSAFLSLLLVKGMLENRKFNILMQITWN